MELVCNVCSSVLHVLRVDNGNNLYAVVDNDLIELSGVSNGYTQITCTGNRKHEISQEIQYQICDLLP